MKFRSVLRRIAHFLALFLADEQGARKRDIKQFDDAIAEIERRIGRRLSLVERRRLHDAISGEGLDFDGIFQEGIALFAGPRDGA